MNKRALFATICAAVLVPSMAAAEQYVQVQAGQSSTDSVADFCDYLDAIVGGDPSISNKCDDKDEGFRISYGYAFNSMFAIEGGYQDLGGAEAKASDGVNSIAFATDATGFDVTGVARWSINDDFVLSGRLGLMRWDIDFTYKESGDTLYDSNDSGTSLLYGVAAEYQMFSLTYEIINEVGDDDLEGFGIGDDVERISLGAKLKF